jgi:hypothetical protein
LDLTEHKAEVHARVGAVEGWIHEVKPRLYSSDKNRAVTNAEIQNIKEKQRSSPDLSLYVPPLPRKDIP